MTVIKDITDYTPGDYGKKRIKPSDWINAHIRKWSSDKEIKKTGATQQMPPTICLSRKIGVGALEIADKLAEIIGYTVADRQIIEHMAQDAQLSEQTLDLFDERYPGKIKEFSSFLFNEKSFIKSDYARQLAKSVYALANLNPTVFVGRGTHLILPRDRVLAVRLIGSREFRIKRLSKIMLVDEKETEKRLAVIDKEQHEFFKTVYGKKDAAPYEFDMVINLDYIPDTSDVAKFIAGVFTIKFKKE